MSIQLNPSMTASIPQQHSAPGISNDQKNTIESVLGEYDGSSLSERTH
jgi:hypothetical protein